MLIAFRELLDERRSHGAAAGAFTCYDLTTGFGVLRAAEERNVGVILLVSEASFVGETGPSLMAALRSIAERSRVPVCLQLDHTSDESLASAAFESGALAVMADGSTLPHAENASLVSRIRKVAPAGMGIEAELGHIEGGEDIAAAVEAGALTNPDQAARFVSDTKPDCLAVSIGNVHGTYARPPELDWVRLAQIQSAVGDTPLSLHGASGLPKDDVRKSISLGISKVNVNTEIRARYLSALNENIPRSMQGYRVLELHDAVVAAVADVVSDKLKLLS